MCGDWGRFLEGRRFGDRGGGHGGGGGSSGGRSAVVVVCDVVLVVGVVGCIVLDVLRISIFWEYLTKGGADQGTSSDTTDTSSGQHTGGVTLVLLLLLLLLAVALLAVGITMAAVGIAVTTVGGVRVAVAPARVAMVTLVVRSSKEATLVVAGGVAIGCPWGTARRWRVWALGWGCVCRRLPLRAASGLIYVEPALAALVELGHPARRHWRRRTVLWCVSEVRKCL